MKNLNRTIKNRTVDLLAKLALLQFVIINFALSQISDDSNSLFLDSLGQVVKDFDDPNMEKIKLINDYAIICFKNKDFKKAFFFISDSCSGSHRR